MRCLVKLALILVSIIHICCNSSSKLDVNKKIQQEEIHFGGKKKTQQQEIHFGAFMSNLLKDDLCYKAAIEAAVQMINEDETILKGYRVKMHYLDNYVSKPRANIAPPDIETRQRKRR